MIENSKPPVRRLRNKTTDLEGQLISRATENKIGPSVMSMKIRAAKPVKVVDNTPVQLGVNMFTNMGSKANDKPFPEDMYDQLVTELGRVAADFLRFYSKHGTVHPLATSTVYSDLDIAKRINRSELAVARARRLLVSVNMYHRSTFTNRNTNISFTVTVVGGVKIAPHIRQHKLMLLADVGKELVLDVKRGRVSSNKLAGAGAIA